MMNQNDHKARLAYVHRAEMELFQKELLKERLEPKNDELIQAMRNENPVIKFTREALGLLTDQEYVTDMIDAWALGMMMYARPGNFGEDYPLSVRAEIESPMNDIEDLLFLSVYIDELLLTNREPRTSLYEFTYCELFKFGLPPAMPCIRAYDVCTDKITFINSQIVDVWETLCSVVIYFYPTENLKDFFREEIKKEQASPDYIDYMDVKALEQRVFHVNGHNMLLLIRNLMKNDQFCWLMMNNRWVIDTLMHDAVSAFTMSGLTGASDVFKLPVSWTDFSVFDQYISKTYVCFDICDISAYIKYIENEIKESEDTLKHYSTGVKVDEETKQFLVKVNEQLEKEQKDLIAAQKDLGELQSKYASFF